MSVLPGGGSITGLDIYSAEITPAGEKALAAVGKIADRMESDLLVRFTEPERKLIRRALLTLAG